MCTYEWKLPRHVAFNKGQNCAGFFISRFSLGFYIKGAKSQIFNKMHVLHVFEDETKLKIPSEITPHLSLTLKLQVY